MPNEQYQSLFGQTPAALRKQFLDGAPGAVEELRASPVRRGPAPRWSPTSAATTCWRCSPPCTSATRVDDRPSVVFAYTIKGWGLPIAGNPRNHSALLTTTQVDELRRAIGLDRDHRVGAARPGHARRDLASTRGGAAGPDATLADPGCRRAGKHGTARGQGDLDPGGLRSRPRRAGPQPGRRAVPGDHRAGRRDVDQPGRLHQQGGRLRSGRAAAVERGPDAALEPVARPGSTSSSASPR